MDKTHKPVLLTEVIDALITERDGIYVDGTFGRGGHSAAILEALNEQGRLIAIDKDPDAILCGEKIQQQDKRFSIHHASFAELSDILKAQDVWGKVAGVLFDLGVSSPQLEKGDRGFSFYQEGPLDMRMDNTQGLSAEQWLSACSEQELAEVLRTYGEERFARRIARAIVEERKTTPLKTTLQLAELVASASPIREKNKHPATRTFQAIRIFINHELDDLQAGLTQALGGLKIGGRIAVISFHSLEDRIVKRFIQIKESGDELPKEIPIRAVQIKSQLRRIGKQIRPGVSEIKINPRARSAVLRVAEKIG